MKRKVCPHRALQLLPPEQLEQARPELLAQAKARAAAIAEEFEGDSTGPSTTYKARMARWLQEGDGSTDQQEKPFVRVHNIREMGGVAAEVAMSAELGRIAAELLQVPAVRLYQARALAGRVAAV